MIRIKHHQFMNVVQPSAVMKAIKISGYNMKLIYNYLEEQGCETIPAEAHQAGKIWVYDPLSNECVTMTEDEFNELFTDTLKIEDV